MGSGSERIGSDGRPLVELCPCGSEFVEFFELPPFPVYPVHPLRPVALVEPRRYWVRCERGHEHRVRQVRVTVEESCPTCGRDFGAPRVTREFELVA